MVWWSHRVYWLGGCHTGVVCARGAGLHKFRGSISSIFTVTSEKRAGGGLEGSFYVKVADSGVVSRCSGPSRRTGWGTEIGCLGFCVTRELSEEWAGGVNA